jgi:hypothetical protein
MYALLVMKATANGCRGTEPGSRGLRCDLRITICDEIVVREPDAEHELGKPSSAGHKK